MPAKLQLVALLIIASPLAALGIGIEQLVARNSWTDWPVRSDRTARASG